MEALQQKFDTINLVSSSHDSDVFLVKKKETGERFLLKSLKEQKGVSGEAIQRKIRFRKEVDTVSSLDHPNIAKPVLTFADEISYSILYPYRRGTTLAKIFEAKGAIAPDEALLYVQHVLDALEYVHARGIIHCDLNPNNIYINEERGLELLDFGLSMFEEEARKVPENRIVGTMPYLSPEQMGFTDFKIDPRSDLFCVGIMLYRMISGSLPFPDYKDSLEELLKFTLKTEVKPVKNIPGYLNTILLKSLKPSPDDRYQTASGFKHDIEQAILSIKEEGKTTFVPGERDAIIAAGRSKIFVGRDAEIEALNRGLEQLESGNGSSFLIFGKSGVGKTEIVGRFSVKVNEERTMFLSSKCNKFSSTQPYSVVRHLILQLLSKIALCSPNEKNLFKETLQKYLTDYSGVICSIIPELHGHFEKVGEIDKVEKEKEAERIIHVLSLLFAAIGLFKQSIVFVDDFQWIDQISFQVLKKFLGMQPSCMLVISFRTEKSDTDVFAYGADLRKIGIRKLLHVRPFSRADIKELVSSRIGDIQDAGGLIDVLCAKTDGNPFTVSEAVQYLVNASILKPSSSGWVYSKPDIKSLPEKFDPVSLVLSRLEILNENEKRYLMLASLIQGKIETDIVEKIGGFEIKEVSRILRKLENLGFIIRKSENHFYFRHDKVQESIVLRLPKNDAFTLNEKIAVVYEEKLALNKELIFNAAEYYLKSKNLAKAIKVCYEAARYASEKITFDIATRYFMNTSIMASQCPALGLPVPVDLIKVQMEFGNVLMMTGRNQQALNTFLKLLEKPEALEKYQQLEIKYRVGSIYHNMGEFDSSIKFFTDTLKQMNAKLPQSKALASILLLLQAIIQFIYSIGLKHLIPKNITENIRLTLTISNKLSYSLFFKDMVLAMYIHLKAMNLADRLPDCYEKAETYIFHIVGAYVSLMKNRSLIYFDKSIKILGKINRKDLFATAECFCGIIYAYWGKWKNAIKMLYSSIEKYRSAGDFWGQIVPIENMGWIQEKKGMLKESIELFEKEIELCQECGDLRGFLNARSTKVFLYELQNVKNEDDILNIENERTKIHDSLVQTIISGYLLKTGILRNQLRESYKISTNIATTIKEKNLNQEYVAFAFSTHCEILTIELRNRLNNELAKQLDLSEKKLLKELIINCRKAFFQGIVYPPHMGAALRCLAWYSAFKGRRRIANYLFKKAIKRHHVLDMRYEEAKSLRDYGLFLEDCNLPGQARDQFNAAYKLFHQCGAVLETDRLKDKADIVIFEHRPHAAPQEIQLSESASEISQVRLDTLYEVSASIRKIDDIDVLLKQVLSAMIKATGAQYGCVFLDGNSENDFTGKSLAMNFDGTMIKPSDIRFMDKVVEETKKQKAIVLVKNAPKEDLDKGDTDRVRSVLCVPLCHGDKYQGCVYLGNDMVSGLFSESAKKTAQILSAQADILLQNAYLMEEFKRLNRNLEKKVKEQTNDIQEKNKQLAENNVKLVDAERMRGLFAGTIVHDIKNFAAGIEGNSTLLAKQYPEDPKVLKTARIVGDCCSSIVSLASNLLDIGKMEEGKLRIKKEILTKDVLFDIADLLRQNVMFEEKNISVDLVDNTKGSFTIEADYYLVERIMQNLFSNAAKYVPRAGTVVLTLEIRNDENVLCFFNSGNPIPDEEKITIFDKYSRLESKGSQYSKGLGLFFCKMVMNAHQGRIWLDTDEKGNYFKLAFKNKVLPVPVSILA
ncbi:MAG TPA: AAA family ATPase [Chitinivibrionales bacterium]|nr:AAA family ATPase [Chitinivibrionales bacterium]